MDPSYEGDGTRTQTPQFTPDNESTTQADLPARKIRNSGWQEGPAWSQRTFAKQWQPFRGMYADVRRRLPYYASDWTLGLQPRK